MFTGKCKTTLNLLSNIQKEGVLHLHNHVDSNSSPTVRDILIDKHPPPQPANNDCILQEEPETPHPIIFESLDASVICSAALKVTGAAGPSANEWRRLCTSHRGDLCSSLARRICSSYVNPITPARLSTNCLRQTTWNMTNWNR